MAKKKVSKKKPGRPVTTGGTPVLNLRVDRPTQARWRKAAKTRGVTLTDLVKNAVEKDIR